MTSRFPPALAAILALALTSLALPTHAAPAEPVDIASGGADGPGWISARLRVLSDGHIRIVIQSTDLPSMAVLEIYDWAGSHRYGMLLGPSGSYKTAYVVAESGATGRLALGDPDRIDIPDVPGQVQASIAAGDYQILAFAAGGVREWRWEVEAAGGVEELARDSGTRTFYVEARDFVGGTHAEAHVAFAGARYADGAEYSIEALDHLVVGLLRRPGLFGITPQLPSDLRLLAPDGSEHACPCILSDFDGPRRTGTYRALLSEASVEPMHGGVILYGADARLPS